jgi:hypothetical protein
MNPLKQTRRRRRHNGKDSRLNDIESKYNQTIEANRYGIWEGYQ